MVHRYLLIGPVMLVISGSALCQTQAPAPRLTLQGPAEQSNSKIIRDALGRPCLDVEAAARRHTVNPERRDHLVSIKNNCPRLIKVKVCYVNSDHCNRIELQSYKRVDTILGTSNEASFFRYTIQQQ